MKHILILLFIMAVCHMAKADGPASSRVNFTMELVNGKTSKGYVMVLDFERDKDSFGNTDFLKKRFTEQYLETEDDVLDSLIFYADIFEYRYYHPDAQDTLTDFQLIERTAIPFSKIKKINVVSYERSDYGGMVNPIRKSDTVWTRTRPVYQVRINGYLCSFYIFVHKTSPKVTAILKELERIQKEYETLPESPDAEYNIDNCIFDLIHQLSGEKVVALEECFC